MFRFERKATVKTAADVAAAVKFAGEVTAYLNKLHSLNMKFGVELFGKARSYLEASLARRPSAEHSLILAELLEDLGEHETATLWLRRAAAQAVGRRSNLPRVRLRRY